MINVEQCRGCGRPLLIHRVSNLVVRLEVEPLDGPQATQALLAGRELWRVRTTSLTPARADVLAALVTADPSERPHVVQEHRCTPVSRLATPPRVSGAADPKGSPHRAAQGLADRATPSPAPRTASSAPSAASRRSEPCCDGCGQPCADGTYASVAVGDLVVWAQHVDTCPA